MDIIIWIIWIIIGSFLCKLSGFWHYLGILLIFMGIVYIIKIFIGRIKNTINSKKDPEKALLELCDVDDDYIEYEKRLRLILKKSGTTAARVRLFKLYSGQLDRVKDAKNDKKLMSALEEAAKAGDAMSFYEYYGFGTFDVKGDKHEEISKILGITKETEQNTNVLNYMKGFDAYWHENYDSSISHLNKISPDSEYSSYSHYLTFCCYLKKNMAQDALKHYIEAKNGNVSPAAADVYKLYQLMNEDKSKFVPNDLTDVAEDYRECEGADKNIANNICADSWYYYYQYLKDNPDKMENDNELDATLFAAAQNGHKEAMYLKAVDSWKSETAARYKSADFFRKAALAGQKDAIALLKEKGVDYVIIDEHHPREREYNFYDGCKLTVSNKTMRLLQLLHGILFEEKIILNGFSSAYPKTFSDFSAYMNKVHSLYADSIAFMIEWCRKLLMHFDLDTYDSISILNLCDDLSIMPYIPNFCNALDRIDARAAKLGMKTAYAQATRSYWTGAGFGTTISGTIAATAKAQVAAGVMNFGSAIAHGIGDSIVKSMNNAEINNMQKDLFKNPATQKEFEYAVSEALKKIRLCIVEILAKEKNIALGKAKGDIINNGENISSLDDRIIEAKINNHSNTDNPNLDYIVCLMTEQLKRNPFSADLLKTILVNAVRKTGTLNCPEVISIFQYSQDYVVDISNSFEEIRLKIEEPQFDFAKLISEQYKQ